MGLFDKKEDEKSSRRKREIRLYSEVNDCEIVWISSKDANIENDAATLTYVKTLYTGILSFRIGNGEYRLSPVKRIKLGEIQDENSNSSSK